MLQSSSKGYSSYSSHLVFNQVSLRSRFPYSSKVEDYGTLIICGSHIANILFFLSQLSLCLRFFLKLRSCILIIMWEIQVSSKKTQWISSLCGCLHRKTWNILQGSKTGKEIKRTHVYFAWNLLIFKPFLLTWELDSWFSVLNDVKKVYVRKASRSHQQGTLFFISGVLGSE